MGKMRSVFKHGDAAYIIIAQKPIQHFAKIIGEAPNMEYVQLYMQSLGCDHVLRNEVHFMFCETIPDVDFEVIE
jgi:hypothetical protein